jgi:hypothetical protein
MGWFRRWYGASPLHLLAMIGCFALAWYAGADLLHARPVGVAVWFVGAVVGHDLILMPLYAVADKSVLVVFRHRPPRLPTVPWINYLRVPVVLSGLLLLIWFPLIFRIPSRFPRTTDLSLDPYLGHWLAVTGALFLLSALALALRFRRPHPEAVPEQVRSPGWQPRQPEQDPRYPRQPRYPQEQQPRYPEQRPRYPEQQPRYPEQPYYPEQQPRYPQQPRYRDSRSTRGTSAGQRRPSGGEPARPAARPASRSCSAGERRRRPD